MIRSVSPDLIIALSSNFENFVFSEIFIFVGILLLVAVPVFTDFTVEIVITPSFAAFPYFVIISLPFCTSMASISLGSIEFRSKFSGCFFPLRIIKAFFFSEFSSL